MGKYPREYIEKCIAEVVENDRYMINVELQRILKEKYNIDLCKKYIAAIRCDMFRGPQEVKKVNRKAGNRKTRERYLKSKYNMSLEEYDELAHQQRGRCAICNHQVAGLLYVDHNHATGEVRGLLCNGCNTGLGHFGDDASNLMRAIGYLLDNQLWFLELAGSLMERYGEPTHS
jgi:hypothetical protein